MYCGDRARTALRRCRGAPRFHSGVVDMISTIPIPMPTEKAATPGGKSRAMIQPSSRIRPTYRVSVLIVVWATDHHSGTWRWWSWRLRGMCDHASPDW